MVVAGRTERGREGRGGDAGEEREDSSREERARRGARWKDARAAADKDAEGGARSRGARVAAARSARREMRVGARSRRFGGTPDATTATLRGKKSARRPAAPRRSVRAMDGGRSRA